MRFLSLFAGVGGFDLGLERLGMECAGQVEINRNCRKVLDRHWPAVKKWGDVREVERIADEVGSVELVCGGDPCPCRSKARSNGASKSPDLSGYFLALVGRLRPQWVVRENVPAPDVCHFASALDALGYNSILVLANAASYTAQSRTREILIGHPEKTWLCVIKDLLSAEHDTRVFPSRLGTLPVVPCLTANRTRYDSRDCYIWDGRFRILDGEERQAFAGFPADWLSGFSESAIARMCGNAVVPQIVEQIGRAIMQVEAA